MIKKFFLTMLGTIAGIWVSIIVFVLGSIIAIGILVGKNADTSAIALSLIHISEPTRL